LHELATNAAKYGALSVSAGRVEVSWAFRLDPAGERRLSIEWSEHGGPAVRPAADKGFGHVVIERVVSQALDAPVTYEFPPEGVRWSIAIPSNFVVHGPGMTQDVAGAAT
jgi:two-component sensor histidine kinase